MKDLVVTSPAFEHEGLIPERYTGRGADVSPEILLAHIDERAKSMVIIMNDVSHIIPAFNHWVIWNLPVKRVIPMGVSHGKVVESLSGAVQGRGVWET